MLTSLQKRNVVVFYHCIVVRPSLKYPIVSTQTAPGLCVAQAILDSSHAVEV
jgi:hypothetical protein